jgi:hypothetical protein
LWHSFRYIIYDIKLLTATGCTSKSLKNSWTELDANSENERDAIKLKLTLSLLICIELTLLINLFQLLQEILLEIIRLSKMEIPQQHRQMWVELAIIWRTYASC